MIIMLEFYSHIPSTMITISLIKLVVSFSKNKPRFYLLLNYFFPFILPYFFFYSVYHEMITGTLCHLQKKNNNIGISHLSITS